MSELQEIPEHMCDDGRRSDRGTNAVLPEYGAQVLSTRKKMFLQLLMQLNTTPSSRRTAHRSCIPDGFGSNLGGRTGYAGRFSYY
jgi:hypothetical protein